MEKLFAVIEHHSFFAVQHIPTGQQHPMGDGVDALSNDDGETLIPGTPGFVEAWEAALNANKGETLEAYFPDLANPNPIKQAYEDGECPDCGDPIPDDVAEGQACENCGHVFCLPKDNDD